MSSKYITAYTPVGYTYAPPYINVSFVDEDTIRIIVRGEPTDGECGHTSHIDIPRDVAIETFYEFEDKIRRD